MKIIEFSFNVAVFCSLRNKRKKALEPKIFEALLGFSGQLPTLHTAGYWDIFPKNDFCRTNHFCLINQAADQFYKAIFDWPRS
jgi:hypothetical protein